MNKDLLKTEKQPLTLIKELNEIHALILSQHMHPIELRKENNGIIDQTAFPTPNHFYKQKINNIINHDTK